jgi:alpha-ketoglutarate-dependent taurine dioxygenase
MSKMTITPLTGAIGAEITGIDLASMTSVEEKALQQAFLDYLVLSIRAQDLDAKSLLDLTVRLGGVGETNYITGLPDYPDVVPVIKEADEKSPVTFGAGWHTDFTFQPCPPSRTLLYAIDTPQAGGDTLYCNLYKAYDLLSPGLATALENLTTIHSAIRSYGPKATLKDQMENMVIVNEDTDPEETEHPCIRVHPVTGRKALWINPVYTIRFKDMSEAESKPLLDYLNALAVSPSLTCRVTWQPGTLTMWDNRCTQHCATSDYAGQRREMLRTTVAGDRPLGVCH